MGFHSLYLRRLVTWRPSHGADAGIVILLLLPIATGILSSDITSSAQMASPLRGCMEEMNRGIERDYELCIVGRIMGMCITLGFMKGSVSGAGEGKAREARSLLALGRGENG